MRVREEHARGARWRLHSCISPESCRGWGSRGQVAGGRGPWAWAVGVGEREREGERERRRWPQARERRRLAAGGSGKRVQARRDGTSNSRKGVLQRVGRGVGDGERSEGAGAVDGVGVALGISGEGYSSRLRQASPWEVQPTRPRLRLPPTVLGSCKTSGASISALGCVSALSARRACCAALVALVPTGSIVANSNYCNYCPLLPPVSGPGRARAGAARLQ